ncbi:ornithine cyclodeaminase family protein [Thermodesulfobacteriota bacterium]
MKTLIISKADVAKVLTPSQANRSVEKAFKAYGSGKVDMPAKTYLTFKKGDLRSMPAYLFGQGFDVAGVKCVNVHPHNHRYNLPSVMAVIVLQDPKNGFPLAIMDGTYLTAMRTGAAGALAAKLLAKKQSRVVGFVGFGMQARTQLACLVEVRKLESIKVWQVPSGIEMAKKFCKWAKRTYHLETALYSDIGDVTTGVDIVVATTPTRKPIITRVSKGTHINAIGADAEGKQEISPRILKRSKIVIDDWDQASHSGEINVPLRKKQITRDNIYGELGEISVGKKKGRVSEDEITLFDSTGLAIQDVACAWTVYEALKDKRGLTRIALF